MYDCMYDQYTSARSYSKHRRAACYASLFWGKTVRVAAHLWLDAPDMLEEAEFFEKNVIEPFLIERVKGTFKTYPYKKGAINSVAKELREGYLAWKTLDIDCKKLSPNDCYVILCLYRYPQEYSKAVRQCNKNIRDGMDWKIAYVKSHQHCGNFNHSILSPAMRYSINNENFDWKPFDIKQMWEDMAEKMKADGSGTIMADNARKSSNLSGYFHDKRIAKQKGWGY